MNNKWKTLHEFWISRNVIATFETSSFILYKNMKLSRNLLMDDEWEKTFYEYYNLLNVNDTLQPTAALFAINMKQCSY
jgi:hypothetical protein